MILLITIISACHWGKTIKVRNFIQKHFEPFLTLNRVKPHSDCPMKNLNSKDLLKDYQDLKHKIGTMTWQCNSCKKHFKSEDYLQQHIINSHIDFDSNSICLSDLCYFLPCQDKQVNIHRCESVMQTCFQSEQAQLAKALCIPSENTWNINMVPLYILLAVVTVIGVSFYYLIIWSEYEEWSPKIHKNKKE